MSDTVTLYRIVIEGHDKSKLKLFSDYHEAESVARAMSREKEIEPVTYYAHPPISREDLETVCIAAEERAARLVLFAGLTPAGEAFDMHKDAAELRAAVARVREGMK